MCCLCCLCPLFYNHDWYLPGISVKTLSLQTRAVTRSQTEILQTPKQSRAVTMARNQLNHSAEISQQVGGVLGTPFIFGMGCFRFNSHCCHSNIKLSIAACSVISSLRQECLFHYKIYVHLKQVEKYTNSGCSLLFIPVSLRRPLIHAAEQLCVIGFFFFFLIS